MRATNRILVPLFAILIALPGMALAQNATSPGPVNLPYPTLKNLSVDWEIEGDDDLDGRVEVRFRQAGASQWREGLPLFRVPAGSNQGFSWQNKHSGSIFDLTPGTTYEIELTLQDPDGGNDVRVVSTTTRSVPQASNSAEVIPVTPGSFSSALSSAQAGDILLLADGEYSGFTVPGDGTEAEPIVIRAENERQAVINGEVRASGRSYVFFEGLTVNGFIKFNSAVGIVVRDCTINTDDDGIVSFGDGTTNGYIADNIVLGSTGWSSGSVGASGNNSGEGIVMTGPGNVITHNYVRGFRDAISTMEDSGAHNQVSIDITYNDIEIGADDGIEADFCQGNCRIMHNRISNSFVGLSSQPGLGGPTYFIRNVMYNLIYTPYKLQRHSRGDVVLHNTVVKSGDAFRVNTGDTWSDAYFRNNIGIGGTGAGSNGGSGRVIHFPTADSSCDFDYDGLGSIGTGEFEGRLGSLNFYSLSELQSETSETHAIELDMSVFADAVEFPGSGPFPERAVPSLRLSATAVAIDAGLPLANINDGYAGIAPDLGAYELGAVAPQYGPRVAVDAPPAPPLMLRVE